MINTPQFTLIPSNYANNPDSGFSIIRNGKKASKKPIIKEDFFLLWLPVNKSEDSLNLAIKRHYPQIPVDKAFTCSIKLAYPKDLNNKKKTNQRPSIIKEVTIGKILPISLSTKILVEIPLIKVPNERNLIFGDRSISGSAYFWSLALKLALQLISEGNIIPKIEKVEQSIEDLSLDTSKAGSLIGSWKPILRSQIDFKNYGNILYLAPLSAHNIPFNVKNVTQIIDPSELLTDYLNSITDILVRQSLKAGKYSSFQDVYGLSPTKIEKLGDKIPWEVRMLSGLIIKNSEFNIYRVSEEVIPDVITKWTQIVNHPYWKDGFNLTLKLKMPSSEVGSWILDYFIQSIRNEEIFIPLKDFWQLFEDKKKKTGKKKSNKNLIKHIDNKWKIRRNILASLNGLSSLFPAIEQSLLKKNPESVKVSVLEASDFLEYIGKQMKSDGFGVIIPDEFTNQGKQRLKTVMHIKSETPEMEKLKDVDGIPKYGEIIDTSFDINSILSYKWELQIGNESLSEDDFNKLLDKKTNEPLIFWNNKWILLERREVSAIRDTFKEQRGGNIKAEQALFLGLTGETYLEKKKKGKNGDNKKFGPYEVILEGPIQEIVDTLTGRKEPEKRQQPKNLNGKLRPYQKIGFNWLLTMTRMGFNICLADDMGLGKTIQVISYILEKLDQKQKFKPKNRINSLIICPTSVLGNWQREIDQFAPDLKVGFYYGSSRPSDLNGLTKLLNEKDILLTSYGLLRRDIKLISLVNWDIVVLDESQ
ncbi:MAG: DEAD/DEAH box helicase, partial [archaeon]|nr:DEAD/DEAH box helicase [archaeon]